MLGLGSSASQEELKSRPKLTEYWAVVKERASFKSADVWDTLLRPGLLVVMLGAVVVDAVEDTASFTVRTATSVGDFLNEKALALSSAAVGAYRSHSSGIYLLASLRRIYRSASLAAAPLQFARVPCGRVATSTQVKGLGHRRGSELVARSGPRSPPRGQNLYKGGSWLATTAAARHTRRWH